MPAFPAGGTVSYDWGDQTAPTVRPVNSPSANHSYTAPGDHTVTATVSTAAGGTWAADTATFTANPPPSAGASPTITVDDVTITAGEGATYSARTQNSSGSSEGCSGRVTINGLGADDITAWSRDGAPLTVTEVAGAVRIVYGAPGFTIGPGFDVSVDYELTLAVGAPAGEHLGTSEILAGPGDPIGVATFTVTVEEAP